MQLNPLLLSSYHDKECTQYHFRSGVLLLHVFSPLAYTPYLLFFQKQTKASLSTLLSSEEAHGYTLLTHTEQPLQSPSWPGLMAAGREVEQESQD